MFGLGATELLLIAIAVLVLLGMGKLPDVARKAGGAYRAYRKVDNEVQKIKNPVNWIDVEPLDDKSEDKTPDDPSPTANP